MYLIIYQVGQTILSCIPLQNLPGLGDAHSAFVGPVPCAECSNGTGQRMLFNFTLFHCSLQVQYCTYWTLALED